MFLLPGGTRLASADGRRLSPSGKPDVNDVHTHPIEPRTVHGLVSVRF